MTCASTGNRTGTKLPIFELSASKVLVTSTNSIPVDVIREAYRIAANYLKATGRISSHRSLFLSRYAGVPSRFHQHPLNLRHIVARD
jgi:hypothetical protein